MTTRRPRQSRGTRRSSATYEASLVAALVAMSVMPYVTRLGFTSDDYDFLSVLALSPDQTFFGLAGALAENPNISGRPVQSGLQALLFMVFGLNPLGYHLVGAALLLALALTCWATLRLLGAPSWVAVAVTVVFTLSPAYSSARLWFAAFGYLVAMTAYFTSVLLALLALRSERGRLPLKGASLGAVALCALGFEVAVPLLVATPLVLAYYYRRRFGALPWAKMGRLRAAFLLGSDLVVLTAILPFKASHAVGMVEPAAVTSSAAKLASTAIGVQFGSFGLFLPEAFWWALQNTTLPIVVLATASSIFVGIFTRDALGRTPMSRGALIRLAGTGLIAFAGGWAIYLSTSRFLFSSTGIANRIGIAGAFGTAIVLVAGLGIVGTLCPSRRSTRLVVPVGLALLTGSYFLISGAVAEHWVRAERHQGAIVAVVSKALSRSPGTSTVLLAGSCPYDGPAIVFESSWDLRGALRIRQRDAGLSADVATPRLSIEDSKFSTSAYKVINVDYLYGPGSLGVAYPSGTTRVLTSRAAIEAFLALPAAQTFCPNASEGRGVPQLFLDRLLAHRLHW